MYVLVVMIRRRSFKLYHDNHEYFHTKVHHDVKISGCLDQNMDLGSFFVNGARGENWSFQLPRGLGSKSGVFWSQGISLPNSEECTYSDTRHIFRCVRQSEFQPP